MNKLTEFASIVPERQFVNDEIYRPLIEEVLTEINKAKLKHGTAPFNSTHEGYAVLLEEVEELWQEIKSDNRSGNMRKEAIQVAAMILRFLAELS
jgi:NTP pyrophosphatase (non-canonical NTP hydrolase)